MDVILMLAATAAVFLVLFIAAIVARIRTDHEEWIGVSVVFGAILLWTVFVLTVCIAAYVPAAVGR